MTILHVAFITDNKANGVSAVVKKYVEEQAKYEKVGLLNLCEDRITENLGKAKLFDLSYHTIESLDPPFNKPDLVIFHEIYRYPFIKLYKELIGYNIPYIIVPHGSLNKKAQKIHRVKKIIGNTLFFKKFIENAKQVQFLTEKEKNMSLKYYRQSYILGNGVYIDDRFQLKDYEKKSDEFKFIYIGRYDIKVKGIDILLEAANKNKKFMRENNIKLYLYGKDTKNKKGRKYIENFLQKNKIEDIIKLNSEIYDEEKIKKIIDADVFIQASRTEGQPLGILEALGYGKPVIATEGTNFTQILEKEKMGWGTKVDQEDISNKMREVYQINKENGLSEYSTNATKYIKENFIWEKITPKALNIYKKIIETKKEN